MKKKIFVPVKGRHEIWEAVADTEAGAATALIKHLNAPQVRSWKQLTAAGYKIKVIEAEVPESVSRKTGQIDFVAGQAAGVAAMEAAEGAANRVQEGWSEEAMEAVRVFGARLGHFTTEQLRNACGIKSPTDQRAWGGVIKRAIKLGLIVHDGFDLALQAHNRPVYRWRFVGYNQQQLQQGN